MNMRKIVPLAVITLLASAILTGGEGACSGQNFIMVGGGAAWEKGNTVTLYIVSTGLTAGQQTDIQTAFNNWDSTLGSNLSFTATVLSSPPSSPSGRYVIVKTGSTSACGAGKVACVQFNYNLTTYHTTDAIINLDGSLISGGNFLGLMAHEVAHTYMMGDCPACNPALTLAVDTISSTSGTSPRCCDKQLMFNITPSGRYGSYSLCE